MSVGLVLKEGPPESVGMDPARVNRIRELGASWVKSGDTPSLVILVARRGVIVLHEAFGVRRHGDATPTLKRDSIFPLASCSKSITAASVMCLVEDGLIGLNRPFIEYLPELDVPGVKWLEEARVADLLCHTSGIDDLLVIDFIKEAGERSQELPPPAAGRHPLLDRLIRLAAGAPLGYRPGTKMIYANFGFILLGDIVRQVSGVPYWQFAQSRLFEPLGMRDSTCVLPPALRERRVYRAPGMPGTVPGTPWTWGIDSEVSDEVDSGSAGCMTTAADLGVFVQMLINGGAYGGQRVLSPASVAAMTRHQVDKAIPRIFPWISPTTGQRIEVQLLGGGYGFGLAVIGEGDRYEGNGALLSQSTFGHVGYGGTGFWADPEREVVGIYLGVSPRIVRDFAQWNIDLLQNAVHAAIVD